MDRQLSVADGRSVYATTIAWGLWGELDYLIIDMPPGTGDIQLTISQSVQVDASVIVTTPHQLSLTDVRKGIMMFDKVNVPVLGVIENMSYFKCDGCGKKHAIFGEAGAKTLQQRFGLETLAELPITPELSVNMINSQAVMWSIVPLM